jgi:hypothetical protein
MVITLIRLVSRLLSFDQTEKALSYSLIEIVSGPIEQYQWFTVIMTITARASFSDRIEPEKTQTRVRDLTLSDIFQNVESDHL